MALLLCLILPLNSTHSLSPRSPPPLPTPSPPPPCHRRVTVSWYDGPGVAGSTGKALINNLDLLVVGPNKSPVYVYSSLLARFDISCVVLSLCFDHLLAPLYLHPHPHIPSLRHPTTPLSPPPPPSHRSLRGNGGNGKGGFDVLNNNEQVFLANPAVGDYEVGTLGVGDAHGGKERSVSRGRAVLSVFS